MTIAQFSGLFDAFNARAMNFSQVAETFVPPSFFHSMLKPCHTLLVGPRGSGKTTLLKMMSYDGWKCLHAQNDTPREGFPFIGVYIPVDRSWRTGLSDMLGQSAVSSRTSNAASRGLVNTHVHMALIETVMSVVSDHSHDAHGENSEVEIIRELAETWKLTPKQSTFISLMRELRTIQAEVIRLRNRALEFNDEDAAARLVSMDYIHNDPIGTSAIAIDGICKLYGLTPIKWALLFDELEISPKWLKDAAFSSMRSINQRILLKMSAAPFDDDLEENANPTAPTALNDYETIPLWYTTKDEGFDFCKKIAHNLINKNSSILHSTGDALGTSILDSDAGRGTYAPGGDAHKRIERLAERDATFAEYLASLPFDYRNLTGVPEPMMAQHIRKPIEIIVFREFFLKSRRGRIEKRSRKSLDIYAGESSVYAISEGNPRWLIGLMNRMIDLSNGTVPIPHNVQSRSILETTNRFRALLRTIPAPSAHADRGLLALIDRIGSGFTARLLGDKFDPEPALSFIVPADASNDLLDAVSTAVRSGALVYLPDSAADIAIVSPRGKRFRISFMLAPNYSLPLIKGRYISLNSLIHQRDDTGRQLSIF